MDEEAIRKDWDLLSEIRTSVKLALESAREAKEIGSSLQARVVVETSDDRIVACLNRYRDELDSFFVVSAVRVNTTISPKVESEKSSWHYQQNFALRAASGKVHVLPPADEKCSRCWRYLAHEEDGLCERCDDVVTSLRVSGDAL
jgi:isoleucyl-tRNA synthetase